MRTSVGAGSKFGSSIREMGSISAVGGLSSSRLRCADMPNIDGKDVSPDEAMLLGRCPECGQPLIPKTARAHASAHWFGRDPNDPWLSEEARRRYKLIIDFVAARYDPSAATQKPEQSDPNGKRLALSEPFDTRAYWIDQLIAAGIVGVGVDLRHDHPIAGYVAMAVGFVWLAYLRWEHKPMAPRLRTSNFLPVTVLFLATVVVGYDIYDRQNAAPVSQPKISARGAIEGSVQVYPPPPTDPRLAPLAIGSRFLSDLPPDTKETVWIFCYPFDPMSCNIARQYQKRFRAQWTTGFIKYGPTEEPDFSGINIAVRDLFDPAPGAISLKKELGNCGIDADLRPAPDLKPNEFEVWIGRKP